GPQRGQQRAHIAADAAGVRARSAVEGDSAAALHRPDPMGTGFAVSRSGAVRLATAGMPSLHDDIWERLPADFAPYEESRRRAFLLERVAPGERVLDIGCGDGRFTAALAGHGAHPVGADVSPVALARARERHSELEFVPLEADGPLPFADASFAVAWASELLGHVADTGGLLSELRRVLAPRGRLLVTTPYHGPVVPARRLD